jgi:hypothetical protein
MTTSGGNGRSVFSVYVEETPAPIEPPPRADEPEIVRRGPQPIIPPAGFNSSPSEKLLDWIINRWPENTVTRRNICQFGPGSIRNRKSATDQAEILARHGWLIPLAVGRHDAKKWQIVRRPGK